MQRKLSIALAALVAALTIVLLSSPGHADIYKAKPDFRRVSITASGGAETEIAVPAGASVVCISSEGALAWRISDYAGGIAAGDYNVKPGASEWCADGITGNPAGWSLYVDGHTGQADTLAVETWIGG